MAEAAAATGGGGQQSSTPAPPPTPSAGAALDSGGGGNVTWMSDFKNAEVKSYVSQKGFKTVEDLATSFHNLEKMKGVPEERLLRLPEKMEGAELRSIYERLGAPKEAKGYELPRDEKTDVKFTEFAEGMFHKVGVTKTQAHQLQTEYNNYAKAQIAAQAEARLNAIKQGDESLRKEWGAAYDSNVNIAKQGVKVLGLDAKTLDLLEMSQGRQTLYKTLHKIGVGVGESTFIDGNAGGQPEATQEQAQEKIKALINDKKFSKRLLRGDVEAKAEWDRLNKLAAPGEKQIG